MHTFFSVGLLLIAAAVSYGETFFGYSTPTNRLIIGSNEAIVIYAFEDDEALLVKDDSTNSVRLGTGDPARPRAIAGPAELLFLTNSTVFPLGGLPPALLTYKRIKNGGIVTQIVPYGMSNSISVASNETIKFFQPTESARRAEFKRGAFVTSMSIQNNLEVSGPMEITFFGGSGGFVTTYSYCFVGQFLVMPEFVEVPTGTFELRIEKSTDLTNWIPVVVNARSEDSKAFYRMRFDK